MSEDTQVRNNSIFTHFTILPHVLFSKLGHELSKSEFILYLWYRSVCSNGIGSCWMSIKKIRSEIAMSDKTITSSRNRLAELGMIDVDRKKVEKGVQITVTLNDNIWQENADRVNNRTLSKNYEPEQTSIEKTTITPPKNLRTNKNSVNKNSLSRQRRDDDPSFNLNDEHTKAPSFSDKAACTLHEALAKKRKIMSRTNISQWTRTIHKFLDSNNIAFNEFKVVLTWYCHHIGGEYIPQAYSADSFCKKFVQIQDAMERDDSEPAFVPNNRDGSIDPPKNVRCIGIRDPNVPTIQEEEELGWERDYQEAQKLKKQRQAVATKRFLADQKKKAEQREEQKV